MTALIRKLLRESGNVEENPGPLQPQQRQQGDNVTADLVVMSYNVRGLNDDAKLRHLTNFLYKLQPVKNKDLIVGIQESYVNNEGKLPYLWRGNLIRSRFVDLA